ncbi:hypothetical protein LLG10_05700 [bacterium]|nr:hypothetical protein [bacterium]
MTDTKKNQPVKHQTLESIFTRNFRAHKGEVFSIIGLKTVTVLPVLSNNMPKGSIGVLFFDQKKEFELFQSYVKEFGHQERFRVWFHDALHPTIRWKPEQFDNIYQLDVQYLMEEPVYILSNYLKLLKYTGSLSIFLEFTPKTDLVLHRLLQEAEMGEMVGLLEKVGFESQFLIRTIKFHEQQFYAIRSTKGMVSNE